MTQRIPRRAAFGQRAEPRRNLTVRAAMHPPAPQLGMAVGVDVQRAALGEPEIQNLADLSGIIAIGHVIPPLKTPPRHGHGSGFADEAQARSMPSRAPLPAQVGARRARAGRAAGA